MANRPQTSFGAVDPPVDGNEIYLAEDGNDENTGRRPEKPWRSISRLNQAIIAGAVQDVRQILFRRGDEFFGEIEPLPQTYSSNDSLVRISAYGVGDMPRISGYKILERPDAWQNVGQGLWRISLTDQHSYRGNMLNSSANTGFLRVDGRIYGAKRWSSNALVDDWDFFNDQEYLYVKLTDNPSEVTDDLRAAVSGVLITGSSGLSVSQLELVGSGGHGFRQACPGPAEVSDCYIHEIGGAQLRASTRYGNGVELWMGTTDVRVERNFISEIYDAACTIQGQQDGRAAGITDCTFSSNRIVNASQSFEFWGSGDKKEDGAGLLRCDFTDNICVSAGMSWGYAVRPDRRGKGNFIMVYRQEVPVDIRITDNVFFDARDCYLFVNTNHNRLRQGVQCDRNVIALRPGTLVQAQASFTIEEAESWSAATGNDRSSRWHLVPPSIANSEDAVKFVEANLEELRR